MPKAVANLDGIVQISALLPRSVDDAVEAIGFRRDMPRRPSKARTPHLGGRILNTLFLPKRLDRAIEAIVFERDVRKSVVITDALRLYLKKYPKGRGEAYKRLVIQHALEDYVAHYVATVEEAKDAWREAVLYG